MRCIVISLNHAMREMRMEVDKLALYTNIQFSNLRAEMARSGVTIQDVADSIGVNRDTAARKLARKSPITLDEAFKIERKFFCGLGITYLFAESIDDHRAS